MQQPTLSLNDKIEALAPAQRAEAEHFVDALQANPQEGDVRSSAALSKPAFAEVWSSPEDDVYDAL